MNHAFQKIINDNRPVLIDFHATWCGPCKIQSPELEKLKKIKGDKVRIFKIDVDQYPDIAGSYQVSGVPTLILFKEGKILWRQSGVVPANQLSKIIEQSV